jgi:hypothetical protein
LHRNDNSHVRLRICLAIEVRAETFVNLLLTELVARRDPAADTPIGDQSVPT